jgi:glucokinase
MFPGIIPISFPNYQKVKEDFTVIAADVGGTKTHLALFRLKNEELILIRDQKYASQDFPSFSAIVKNFEHDDQAPSSLCIGFAGPVMDNFAHATNLSWSIDAEMLRDHLNIPKVYIINDLESSAYGLAALKKEDFITLDKGNPERKGNGAIIAPGTGLGEAGLFWDGSHFHPFATEGGHTDFGTRNEIDIALYQYLAKKYGHVSWERVASGMGIFEIYNFLLQYRQVNSLSWMKEKIATSDPAAAVSYGAKNGCPISEETFRLFWRYLAAESANLALKLKATGGLFIAGGVAPKNLDVFNQQIFMEYFYEAGRMRPMLQEVPVHIVINQSTSLLGAALYGFFGPEVKTVTKQTM